MNANIIQIRNLTADDNTQLLELQKQFHIKTNSQAALQAVRSYMPLYNDFINLRSNYKTATDLIREYEDILNSIRTSILRFPCR